MLTRLREGTPDAVREGRAEPGTAAPDAVGAPLRIEALGHSFGELRAIERVDLEAEAGEVVGIVGPSGCGKTTLLELVAGLRPSDSGMISVGGQSRPRQRLERCAYMPQRDLLLPWLSALDNAATGPADRGGPAGGGTGAGRRALRAARPRRASSAPVPASSREACASASPSSAR